MDNQPDNADDILLRFPRPLYLVICPISGGADVPYEPISHEFVIGIDDVTTSFDSELVPILPAVWYALHLPATRFEVLDVPLIAGIREGLREKRRHTILMVPAYALSDQQFLSLVVREGEPMLILSDDDHFEIAAVASKDAGFVLPPVRVSDLNEDTLQLHWQMMSEHWRADWPAEAELDVVPPQWSPQIPTDGSALPLRRLLKSLGRGESTVFDEGAGAFASVFDLLSWRAFVEALAGLEERGLGIQEAVAHIDSAMAEASRRIRVPMTLSLPGVAPRYRRLVREAAGGAAEREVETSAGGLPPESSARTAETASADPPEVLSLMVAHNAAGDNSLGLVFADPIPDAAFVTLADLERYWVESSRSSAGAQPAKEARLRGRLDETMQSFWTESMVAAVRSASQIDAFTNFPIGLLRMPGHSAPLAALIPIAYRPINPLTRAFQLEFAPDRVADLSRGMRVLVVECIPDADPVGRISRSAWSFAAEQLTEPDRSVFVDLVEVSSKDELRTAVAAHRPDVLVLSAHGVYDADSNMAGLAIGTDVSVGDDLGPMPPMVILSACHSGPRGTGPVSVADLLLRAGAIAVLSTLVPVDVRHNSTFMTRLLVYMSEAIGGSESHTSVLDLWHRVQTNTVILDILYGNPHLLKWGHSPAKGTPPVVEFMASRSRGRLRPWRLYEDAEAVLLEIAADRGDERAVRGWLRVPG